MVFHEIPSIAEFKASSIPFAHVLKFSTTSAKGLVLTKALMPLAIESPTFFHLIVLPNALVPVRTVLIASPIVVPIAPNNSGDIRPLMKLPKSVPNFSAL